MTQSQQEVKRPVQSKCDECGKETDELYDVTPAAIGDITTIHVCADCYDTVVHELEQDGYDLNLGMGE